MSYRAYSITLILLEVKSGRNDLHQSKTHALTLQICEDFGIKNGFSVSFCYFQVWFKNRRAKCRQQQQQQQNGPNSNNTTNKPRPAKKKTPPPTPRENDAPTTTSSDTPPFKASPSVSSSMPNNNSIWSPASIAPQPMSSDHLAANMSNNSCMQHSYTMPNAQPAAGYTAQGYQSPYFGAGLDYLSHMPQFPGSINHQMAASAMNNGPMTTMASQLPPPHHAHMPMGAMSSAECIDGKEQPQWKFQSL